MSKSLRKVNFEIPVYSRVTLQMWKLIADRIKQEFGTIANYHRYLYKRDLNCDDYGNKTQENSN